MLRRMTVTWSTVSNARPNARSWQSLSPRVLNACTTVNLQQLGCGLPGTLNLPRNWTPTFVGENTRGRD